MLDKNLKVRNNRISLKEKLNQMSHESSTAITQNREEFYFSQIPQGVASPDYLGMQLAISLDQQERYNDLSNSEAGENGALADFSRAFARYCDDSSLDSEQIFGLLDDAGKYIKKNYIDSSSVILDKAMSCLAVEMSKYGQEQFVFHILDGDYVKSPDNFYAIYSTLGSYFDQLGEEDSSSKYQSLANVISLKQQKDSMSKNGLRQISPEELY